MEQGSCTSLDLHLTLQIKERLSNCHVRSDDKMNGSFRFQEVFI